MATVAYLALGSNLGDRRGLLDQAIQVLRARPDVSVTKVSSYHETAPVGGPPGQPRYLNAAAELWTDLGPEPLLQVLLDLETRLGRVRQEKNDPRTLDLDLLFYGDLVRDHADPLVPHPRLHERTFVLAPLAEIAAHVVHPVSLKTVRELLARVRSEGRELTGQRAVVTGSTSGIGQALALELAVAGADVVIHGRRSQATADAVAGQVRSTGVRALTVLADLSQAAACQQLVDQVWAAWGGADIWINNAGADTLTGEAAAWSFERKLDQLLAVDVTATLLLARAVGQRMKAAGGGAIVNMGWDQAETGMEGDSGQLFAASKAAVMAFTKSLALTLAPAVRVNCLAPGWIRTSWGENASAFWQARVLRETPLQRWGTPLDVAAAARWLVAPAARFLTGQMIRVNGGAVR